MRPAIDLTGQRFGSWTVLGRHETDYHGVSYDSKLKQRVAYTVPMWDCRCDCGHEEAVNGNNLRQGRSTKCRFCRDKAMHDGLKRHHRAAKKMRELYPTEYANV